MGDALLRMLRDAGLQAKVSEYELQLHQPIEASLTVLSPVKQSYRIREKVLPEDPFTAVADQDIPYFAYVPDFDVTAEVVYANYGSREDYAVLKEAGINLEGKIALVRAQGVCRGMKGMIAEEEHLAGLLLYPELKDMGFLYPAYPEGRHINPWTIERGSMLKYFLYPGESKAPRGVPGSTLPIVPAFPVSEEVATQLLQMIEGQDAPVEWKGTMNTAYRIGMQRPVVEMKFRGNFRKQKIRNIIATIPGSNPGEPGVMLGAHYDAWVYGAADPSSGTAVVMEAATVLAEMSRNGWQPRRTIQFAFWDAEEFGMLGSTRWVENSLMDSNNNLAIYLSVDTAVRAKDFVAYIQPGIRAPLDEALQRVPDPSIGKKISELRGTFMLPGFSGDVAPFTSLAGVPTAEIAFGRFYPMYHSIYDDYQWFATFADPGFKYSAALTRILLLYASAWTDRQLLPFQFTEVAEYARDALDTILQQHPELRKSHSWQLLDQTIDKFRAEAERLERARDGRISEDLTPQINEHLQATFRSFSDVSQAFPVRNLLIGPSEESGCEPDPLPGLNRSARSGDFEKEAIYLATAFQHATSHLKAAADAARN